MNTVAICSKCVLPVGFPGISFDEQGVCDLCRQPPAPYRSEFDERQRREFEEVVRQSKGQNPYDALCCYSGGKDSTYMLKRMVHDFGLSVLAFTLDNGFITDQSKANIRKIVEVLNVDHLFFKPSGAVMRRMYRQAVLGNLNAPRGNYSTRISDVCLSCISLVNSQAAKIAIQHRIPMIFAGFTPGQIPRAVIKNHHRFYRQTFSQHRDHWYRELGEESERYLNVPDSDEPLYQMSPYLVYETSEADILQEIRQLGWEHPEQLDGCTSNCALNSVGNLCHQKKFGFHPYALELSTLVRKGLLSRKDALDKLALQAPDTALRTTMVQVGLSELELGKLELGRLRKAA